MIARPLSHTNPRRKAIFLVMLVIITLSSIFLIQKTLIYQRSLNQATEQNIERARLIVKHNLDSVKLLYQYQLLHITEEEEDIVDAFQRRNREDLYKATLHIYDNLKKGRPEFSNMHFHLPDGSSFLRMHKASEFGDNLNSLRPMIAQIHKDKQDIEGYEIGVHGLFYRFIKPIFVNDEYLGALEIGIKPEIAFCDIETILNVKIALFLLNEAEVLETHEDPVEIQEHYKIAGYAEHEILSVCRDHHFHLHKTHRIKSDQGHFLCYPVAELHDFKGNPVGSLVIAQKIDKQLAEYRKFILISCLATAGLTFAAYLILCLTFNPMIQKIITLNESLEQKVKDRTQDLYESKKKTEEKNAELFQILNTAAGAMRILDKNFRTLKVNRTFEKLSGMTAKDMIGKSCYDIFSGHLCHTSACTLQRILDGEDHIEAEVIKTRADGVKVPCLLTATAFRSPNGELLGIIEDFRDISILKQYVDKEKINVDLAQRILGLINTNAADSMKLNDQTSLYSRVIFSSSEAAGGDHFFIRQFPPDLQHSQGRTVLCLKDQSGHEVNCVLKSIATDLMHNVILHSSECKSLMCEMRKLNREICVSGLFNDDDFITAIAAEIDHQSMVLKYVSCGHPPFLLIRGNTVLSYPKIRSQNRQLPLGVLPDILYTASEIELQTGDRIIFYTDGLLDMPIQHTGRVLSVEELEILIHDILRKKGNLHLSELLNEIFLEVVQKSGERILPFQKNTSKDDVTLFGIELEDQTADVTKELYIDSHDSFSWHLQSLIKELHEKADEHRFAFDESRLRIVLEESLLNAWKHGHGCSPEIPITVRWRFRNDFHLDIINQGQGFDIDKIPDPTEEQNLLNESGRGVFMIRKFADNACWTDQGRCLCITFNRMDTLGRRKTHRKQNSSGLNIWTNTKADC